MSRTLLCLFASLVPLLAQPRLANAKLESRAISAGLESELKGIAAKQTQPAWIGYTVPIVPGDRQSCCYYTVNGMSWSGCALEPRQQPGPPAQTPSGPVRLESSSELHVLYRIESGQVGRIRSFTGDCELDAGGLSVLWLTGVRPPDSIAFLATFLNTLNERDRIQKSALSTISLHSDPLADTYLEKYVAIGQPEWIRRDAAFWLGSARGRKGYELLKQIVADMGQGDRVREAALHGLTQSREPEAIKLLIEVARSDQSSRIRGQALFWLAQRAGKQAVPAITQAIDNDPEFRVKERAVFALSQLPKDEGVPLLIEVAKNNRNPEVRKKAMFWLGQSRDPRAVAFFEELLKR
jgi:hypothetical protein